MGKKAVVLKFDSGKKEWVEEVEPYTHYLVLFKRLAKMRLIEGGTFLFKNQRMQNLWDDWVAENMTDKDRKMLKTARKKRFGDFTETYLSRFDTYKAIETVIGLMVQAYRREKSGNR